MPKLHTKTVALRREAIAAAAKRCFLRHGFHGVSMRDIADEACCSLGKLNVHFPDKISIYRHVLRTVSNEFLHISNPLIGYLLGGKFPADLEKLASATRVTVERYDDYYRLAYLDAAEFGGRHVRDVFSNLEERFRGMASGRLEGHFAGGLEKSFALTAAYLSFMNYFMLSRHFGATQVFRGGDDQEAIRKWVHLFRRGIGKS
ncbi:MAG: TetR/AcrR family transcriptional regulator [Myxococcaceae bacterium]|nr:TetR/AcrR family transcriptional regulator [Myxococcaceae bacterium]